MTKLVGINVYKVVQIRYITQYIKIRCIDMMYEQACQLEASRRTTIIVSTKGIVSINYMDNTRTFPPLPIHLPVILGSVFRDLPPSSGADPPLVTTASSCWGATTTC